MSGHAKDEEGYPLRLGSQAQCWTLLQAGTQSKASDSV